MDRWPRAAAAAAATAAATDVGGLPPIGPTGIYGTRGFSARWMCDVFLHTGVAENSGLERRSRVSVQRDDLAFVNPAAAGVLRHPPLAGGGGR